MFDYHMFGAIYDALLVSIAPLAGHKVAMIMIMITIIIPLVGHDYQLIRIMISIRTTGSSQLIRSSLRPLPQPWPQAVHQSHSPAVFGGPCLDALAGGGPGSVTW